MTINILDKKESLFSKFLAILNAIASIWVFILMLIIGYDVLGRYFFNSPLSGTPEIAANSIVAIAWLHFPYVLMKKRHINTNVISRKFSPRLRKVISVMGNTAGVIIFTILLKSAWPLFTKSFTSGEWEGVAGGFHVPIAPIRFLLIVGSLALAGEYLRQLIAELKTKAVPREED